MDVIDVTRLVYEENNGKFLCMNNGNDSWIIGDQNHSYSFTMMDESSFSPATWDTYWNQSGSLEMPTLRLIDPTILPPKQLTLSPTDPSSETFYEGEYEYKDTRGGQNTPKLEIHRCYQKL